MKDSSEWVRQPMVDQACDELAAQMGCPPAQITPYAVAKHLNREPNGSFYAKVQDWRRRRSQQGQVTAIEVPPALAAEFREVVDRFADDIYANFIRAVGMAGGEIERAASLRVNDADRRRSEAEAETAEVLDLCTAGEAVLANAKERIEALGKALEEAQRREDRLTGRIEQLQASLGARPVSSQVPTVDRGEPTEPLTPRQKRSYRKRTQAELPLGAPDRGPA